MSTLEKVIIGLLVVLVFLLFGTLIVSAEDNDVGICTESGAVNYPGKDIIDMLKEAGLRPVNDGSCYYLKCVEVMFEDGTGTGAYSCDMGTADDQNFDDWVNDRLPGQTYGPAYYGQLIDTGGCTDPAADNFMDQQWFPDYNIIDDGSCVYPEPENAL